jgi:DNA-binding IclR family transcriptional regulator
LGKALILDLDETRWRKFYEVGEARGVRHVRTLEEWLERMRVYASQGVTFDLEENEPQIYCIAAPIRDASGGTVAAFSVSTTAPYLVDGRMEKMTGEIREVGYAISRALGWPGPAEPGTPNKTLARKRRK